MSKFKNISEFEEALKDGLSGHSTPPPTDAWSQISASTSQAGGVGSQIASYFASTTQLLKVALFVGGIAAIGIVIYNENKEIETPAIQTEIVEQISTEEAEAKEVTEEENAAQSTSDTKNIAVIEPKESRKVLEELSKEDVLQNQTQEDSNLSEMLPEKEGAQSTEGQTADKKEVASEVPQVVLSNTKACVGEVIAMSSSVVGDWLLNGKIVYRNTQSASYTCEQEGEYEWVFQAKDVRITKELRVSKTSFEIERVENINGRYIYRTVPNIVLATWQLNGKIVATNSASVSFSVNEVGAHKLVAVPVDVPCAQKAEVSIQVEPIGSVKVYNIFTPNGDPANEVYKVDIDGYEDFNIQIFDKNSQLVFVSDNPKIGWDGTVLNQGVDCPSGEYFVKLNYKLIGESKEIKNIRIELKRE